MENGNQRLNGALIHKSNDKLITLYALVLP